MKENTKAYSFPLLIVEDNTDDVALLRRLLANAGTINPIQIVRNGEEAVDYLSGQAQYADRTLYPIPRLLITDIKMARLSGFELLQWLRSHPQLRTVPTLVLTISDLPQDVEEAFRLGAHGYFVKPFDIARLQTALKVIHDYWALSLTPDQKMLPDGSLTR